ncbi:MAG: D-tyrosyl-tRNA(Tyr) deacylase [Erysipelotrichaceae bacterium]|nr:D-tyrosyl-tRNA(Tyr) deacylase [Erysipelotrichaceae bacterium]
MRILLQVVKQAAVSINDTTISKIGPGMLLFIGFTKDDDEAVVKQMVAKVLGLRIFPDENGKTNLNIQSINGEILSVSQFTLYANTKKGRRPSFVDALGGTRAKELYEYFNQVLKEKYPHVQEGEFGANMQVSLINDGPVTIWLDSKELYGE